MCAGAPQPGLKGSTEESDGLVFCELVLSVPKPMSQTQMPHFALGLQIWTSESHAFAVHVPPLLFPRSHPKTKFGCHSYGPLSGRFLLLLCPTTHNDIPKTPCPVDKPSPLHLT